MFTYKNNAPPARRRAISSLLALLLGPASGGLLLRLSTLGAAELFTRQFLVKGLATIDADLAAFIFSAHALIVASRGSTWQKWCVM
jgi:hypothetical protein